MNARPPKRECVHEWCPHGCSAYCRDPKGHALPEQGEQEARCGGSGQVHHATLAELVACPGCPDCQPPSPEPSRRTINPKGEPMNDPRLTLEEIGVIEAARKVAESGLPLEDEAPHLHANLLILRAAVKALDDA